VAKEQTKQGRGSRKGSGTGSSRSTKSSGGGNSRSSKGSGSGSSRSTKSSGGGNSKSSEKRRAPRKSGQGSNGSQGTTDRSQQRRAAKDADRDRPGSPFKYGTDEGGKNQTGGATVPEREYQDYTMLHPGSISDTDEPDVLVDIPVVEVEEIHFELDNLMARVSLHAEVLDLVTLSVGVHAELGKVELTIKGVEAQALLRARLDHVTAIIDRVLTTLDRNPELIQSIGRSVEKLGSGVGKGVGEIGQGAGHAVEDVGEGAEGAVKDVGRGAGSAVEDVGKGAGGAVEDVGSGAGQAVGDVGKGVGQGAGEALGDVGEGAGQAVGGLGQGAGQAVEGLGQGGGQALGQLGQLPGALTGGGAGRGQGGDGITGPSLAKEAVKVIAKEIGSAATDEAKDLGLAATHKAVELGERRRQRRATKHNATEAALRAAEEAGIDLDDVKGTGADGRIVVRDVHQAKQSS
jgi:e3 binding domain